MKKKKNEKWGENNSEYGFYGDCIQIMGVLWVLWLLWVWWVPKNY